MYTVEYTNKFKKDLKRCVKRGLDIAEFQKVAVLLQQEGTLPAIYRPHRLSGKRSGQWECHIRPDWLLVWEQHDDVLTLLFTDTGTHSDLF